MHFFFLVQGLHHLSMSSTPNFARHFLVSVGAGNEIGGGEATVIGVEAMVCRQLVGNTGDVGRARGDVTVVER